MRNPIPTALLLALALTAFPGLSQAQVNRYQPNSPTVSPYLNLSRENVSGLPNYYALVRPQIRQQEINRQAQMLLRGQQREITELREDFQRELPADRATGHGGWFQIPGDRIRYLDSSAYYPQPAIMRPRR